MDIKAKKIIVKLEQYFKKNHEKYYYSHSQWNELEEILNYYKEQIAITNDETLFEEAILKLQTVEKIKESKSTGNVFNFKEIAQLFQKMNFGFIVDVFKFSKILFIIPILTICASLISWPISLLFNSVFFSILPPFINELHTQTLIALVVYLFLNYYIFKNLYLKNLSFNYKTYLIKYFCSIPFWSLLFLVFLNKKLNFELIIILYWPHAFFSSLFGNIVVWGITNLVFNSLVIYLLNSFIIKLNKK